MTDEELLDVLEHGKPVPVPYWGGEIVSIELGEATPEEALPALKNFLTLTTKQRQSDARHLVAYCKMTIYMVGEEILEDMDGVEPEEAHIWEQVKIRHIFFSKLEAGKYASRPTTFLQVEGEVSWEPEHGLQMSWADGDKLVKVGEFDGHPTNGHASANPDHDQYVFYCYDAQFCTLPDPT